MYKGMPGQNKVNSQVLVVLGFGFFGGGGFAFVLLCCLVFV